MNRQTLNISQLSGYLAEFGKPISLNVIRSYFRKLNPSISDSTVNWHVHKLVQSSVLRRIGHGQFEAGEVKAYFPVATTLETLISEKIKVNFPFISFCVWNSGLVNEFSQHIAGHSFILIDVEREVAESVYLKIKETFSPVFYRLSEKMSNDLLPDFENPIVVRTLATESPLLEKNGLQTITLEKLLVDIYCDSIFNFLEGSELKAIFLNAFYKYTINENKLLRYASRKGHKTDLQKYINSLPLT